MKIIAKARMKKTGKRLVIKLKNSAGVIRGHPHSINLKGLIKNCLLIKILFTYYSLCSKLKQNRKILVFQLEHRWRKGQKRIRIGEKRLART